MVKITKQDYLKAKKELFGDIAVTERIISNYLSKEDLAKQLLHIQPLHYDENKLWWAWNTKEFKWELTDEVNILNFVRKLSFANTIRAKEKYEILESLKQESRLLKPQEIKPTWVQFNDSIIDIESGERIKATPKYFVTNPIKWKLGKTEKTPNFDILFESWVGKDHIQELYEILAFCLVPSYFIHRLFCLIGSGANGKSTYLRILEKFIGEENIISTSLFLLLNQRFESSRLLNKLACLIGETNFNLLINTDLLKKLSGEDMVRCEFKGKNGFDFQNYAKLIMATNSLPPTADKTEGFYRRWKIIDFQNKFNKEKDVLSNIPKEEYENLALKCLNIAKELWNKRIFTNEGDFNERKKRYEDKSNPLMKFITENYQRNNNGEVFFQEFFESFNNYLEERGFRILSAVSVGKQLRNEGFEIKTLTRKNKNGRFILGLSQKINGINQMNVFHIHPYSRKAELNHVNSINSVNFYKGNKEKKEIYALDSIKMSIISSGKISEIELKKGEKYKKSYFGDDFEKVISVLEKEGKIKKQK